MESDSRLAAPGTVRAWEETGIAGSISRRLSSFPGLLDLCAAPLLKCVHGVSGEGSPSSPVMSAGLKLLGYSGVKQTLSLPVDRARQVFNGLSEIVREFMTLFIIFKHRFVFISISIHVLMFSYIRYIPYCAFAGKGIGCFLYEFFPSFPSFRCSFLVHSFFFLSFFFSFLSSISNQGCRLKNKTKELKE